MWEVYDTSNGVILDQYDTKREAQREVVKLNRIHNPPTYELREAEDESGESE